MTSMRELLCEHKELDTSFDITYIKRTKIIEK